ncbi:MAG: family 10 glycosylhydrolase [Pirellulales bacterium]|nr:family 10 glycosylhydrolase [Pirellulales bacterium]
MLFAIAQTAALAQDASALRVRVQWNSPIAQAWQGSIGLSTGEVLEATLLGTEVDAPGSIWVADGRLQIASLSPRAADGVDLALQAPYDAELLLQLRTGSIDPLAQPLRVRLSDVLAGQQVLPLDDQGGSLAIRRTPGDMLRLDTTSDALVFAPSETWNVTVRPHALPAAFGNKVRLALRLSPAGATTALWEHEEDSQLDAAQQFAPLSIAVPLPADEGVYELHVEARGLGLRSRLTLRPPVVERVAQLVVVDSRPPEQPNDNTPWRTVFELNPAVNRWWERLTALPLLPGQRPGPLGSGSVSPWEHSLGTFVQLGPHGREPDASWEAYTLSIERPGLPHVLEIEYPSDVPQTTGVSLIESNAAGAVSPIGVDSGFFVADDAVESEPHLATHRVVFWPRTKTPMVLLTNRREGGRAVYGKIRVLAGPRWLPRREPPGSTTGGRVLALDLDRPLWAKNFGAAETLDRASGRSLMDWRTFYDGGRHLIDYLHAGGHNAVWLGVLADGSTIYPSTVVEPTPRYDNGVLFDDARDPHRKDVLELLLRLFDREGLQLVPTLHFTSPLPTLEALRRPGDSARTGVEPIGRDGRAWTAIYPPQRGQAPYYNLLHPEVQNAILAACREVIARGTVHPAMTGLAIDLSADGYALLPGTDWCLDDATMERFSRATGLSVPGQGPQRFGDRAEFVRTHADAWITWRAEQVTTFYRRLADELRAVRPTARLYLLTPRTFDGPEVRRQLQPSLPRRVAAEDLLSGLGIDAELLRQVPGLVLVRSDRLTPSDAPATRAVDYDLAQSGPLDQLCAATDTNARLFYHEPQRLRLTDFDTRAPFKGSMTWLVSQLSPSEAYNRQRFTHALARGDVQTICDGGWLAPLGQEAAIAGLAQVYRRLPAQRFEPVESARQPVTVRRLVDGQRTLVYLVNDSPWKARVDLAVVAPPGCIVASLDPQRAWPALQRTGETAGLSLELEPFDLAGAEFAAPNVTFNVARVTLPDNVRPTLEARIRDLGDRAAAVGLQAPWDVLINSDFEVAGEAGALAGWQLVPATALAAEQDDNVPYAGGRSLRLSSTGPAGRLISDVLPAPETGRLSVSVWLRVDDASRQPPLRLALEGQLNSRDYYRYAPLGAGTQVSKLGTTWAQFLFQINDLPLVGLSDLRLRFDLLGPGAVSIDKVELYDLWLTDAERVELSKLITTAQLRLEAEQYSDCLRLVEGYWPRLLQSRVSLNHPETVQAAEPAPLPREASRPSPPAAPTWRERIYNLLPRPLRF